VVGTSSGLRGDEEHAEPTGRQDGADQFEPERHLPGAYRPEPQADHQRHGEDRLHDRDGGHCEGSDLTPGAQDGGGLAQHPPPPLDQPAQAERSVRRAQLGRLVLQHRSDGEQDRSQHREEQAEDRGAGLLLGCLHRSGIHPEAAAGKSRMAASGGAPRRPVPVHGPTPPCRARRRTT
jgi:hypothetical protein